MTSPRTAPLAALLLVAACTPTGHPVVPSALGTPRDAAALLAVVDLPGPVKLEEVVAADWAVPREGIWDLDSPKAKSAGLSPGLEPVQLTFQALRHPTQGLFIVDTGVERAMRDRPDQAAVRGVVADSMKLATMKVRQTTGDWLASHGEPLRGVLLTHLHPDHVLGLADVPQGTPVYAGPNEPTARAFLNLFVKGSLDRALAGKGPLSVWGFGPAPSAPFEGIVDLFGDGSAWALWVPGHTGGSVAYLVRTPQGPVLMTGDACHTRAMWELELEAGHFSADKRLHAESLARMRRLVAEHPAIRVVFAHQP